MAVLQQPMMGNANVFAEQIGDDLAPVGTWVAMIIDIKDEFGVMRPKYQNQAELEKVDLTTFLFGFRDQAGQPHMVASKRMKISGNDKSALYSFLKAMMGTAPKYGWDYCEQKGKQCLITVDHQSRKDGAVVFAAVAALSPVPQGMAAGFGGQGSVAQPRAAVQPMVPAARPAPVAAVGHTIGDPLPF